MAREYKTREHRTMSCLDCGVDFKTNSFRTKRCGPCRKSCEYRDNMLDYKWRLKKLLAAAKFRSEDKGHDFNLTHDYLIGLWDATDGTCPISGRKFDLTSWGNKGQVNPNAPSIDRIIPSLGYTQGNVRLVTYQINVALSEYGLDALISLCKDVASTVSF